MSPVKISAITFFFIFGGAMLGLWLRSVLPEHHLNDETRDLIKLGAGLIATMVALLLGLLVASAKSSYDTRSTELKQIAANAILLDRSLAHYGPETREIRGMLKVALTRMIDRIWLKDGTAGSLPLQLGGEVIVEKLQELVPRSDAQREIKSQAESLIINLGQTRLLLSAQNETSISTPFLVVVVFWLSVLFASFGLLAPRNATAILTLLVAAISVAGALFLILELDDPFSGLIQISSAPLHSAVEVIGK